MYRSTNRLLAAALVLAGMATVQPQAGTVQNPFLWADVPDISIVRVADTYYMSSTTMHMAPGVPVMESPDLVHWKMASYVYQTMANVDELNLASGKSAYGKGSWASSLRYKDGTFYCLFPSYTTNKTYLYTTKDIHATPWKLLATYNSMYHDPSLLFDDDGNNYILYGSGDIKIVQLSADLSGLKSGGLNNTLIANAASTAGTNINLAAEGTQVHKINGYYYVFNICWPSGSSRTEIVHRSKSLSGPWEGKVVNSDQGVAQGSLVDTKENGWMGYLFQDHGGVGRTPWLFPVSWADSWPSFNGGKAPTSFTAPLSSDTVGSGIITSDEFSGTTLPLEWQWNHNPDVANWSLSAHPGYLRITAGRTDAELRMVRNVLTQRSFGAKCSGRIALDASGLKDGDIAGLVALQDSLGYVAVKNSGGSLTLVQVKGKTQQASVALSQKRVYLRIDMDFTNRTDKATFFYSLDSTTWNPIGSTLSMPYTLGMFMGYRFGLFEWATKSAGGTADFDWFRIGASASATINLHPVSPVTGIDGKGQERTAFLPGSGRVQIYDAQGRSVAAAFLDGNASLSSAVAKAVSRSGVYLVRQNTPEGVQTRKVVVGRP